MVCQIDRLRRNFPASIRSALAELPESLDQTYEQSLLGIDKEKQKYSQRLFQCLSVSIRPLRVEELAEILAMQFDVTGSPTYNPDWRPLDVKEAVLSTCSNLIAIVDVDDSQVVQFSHFSVKEFLTSDRLAMADEHLSCYHIQPEPAHIEEPILTFQKSDSVSRRYRISMTQAHTVIAQICLGMLLHLDQNVTRDTLTRFPLAEYAAKHWLEHTRFEGVSQNTQEGLKQLFDRTKPYFFIWLWIHDPTVPPWMQGKQAERPTPPRGTPLHYAAFCGLHDIATILATEHPRDMNSQSFNDASTPLHLTSREGHMDLAQMLIERGVDVSAQSEDGRTPLHLASLNGHGDLARMLVDHGADPAFQDKDGSTPLHLAVIHGHSDLARMLVAHGADVSTQSEDGRTPLHLASLNGHGDLARMLVDHGADPASQDKDGSTPLHLAVIHGHSDLSRMLVEHGADVAAQDNVGSTPLHRVSQTRHVDIAQFLVEQGADVTGHDQDGSTPLHWASRTGQIDLARFLVENGADVTAQDMEGLAPSDLASQSEHVNLTRFFQVVEQGVDVIAQDKGGSISLHRASQNGHLERTLALLRRGTDANSRDENDVTPLHLASRYGHLKIVHSLLNHGAASSPRDESDWTPLHFASREGHLEVVQLLLDHCDHYGALPMTSEQAHAPIYSLIYHPRVQTRWMRITRLRFFLHREVESWKLRSSY